MAEDSHHPIGNVVGNNEPGKDHPLGKLIAEDMVEDEAGRLIYIGKKKVSQPKAGKIKFSSKKIKELVAEMEYRIDTGAIPDRSFVPEDEDEIAYGTDNSEPASGKGAIRSKRDNQPGGQRKTRSGSQAVKRRPCKFGPNSLVRTKCCDNEEK